MDKCHELVETRRVHCVYNTYIVRMLFDANSVDISFKPSLRAFEKVAGSRRPVRGLLVLPTPDTPCKLVLLLTSYRVPFTIRGLPHKTAFTLWCFQRPKAIDVTETI